MPLLSPQGNPYQRGRWGERVALEYLSRKKLKLLEKNFRSTAGEIDLIMQDRDIIVFIEVRYRSNNNFHAALESIDHAKCHRIILTSSQYLSLHPDASRKDCRFDVVTLSGKQRNPAIDWIQDAFRA